MTGTTLGRYKLRTRRYTATATINLATDLGKDAKLVGFTVVGGAAGGTLARLLNPDGINIAGVFCGINEIRTHLGDSYSTASWIATPVATATWGAFPSPLPVYSTQETSAGVITSDGASFTISFATTNGEVEVYYYTD